MKKVLNLALIMLMLVTLTMSAFAQKLEQTKKHAETLSSELTYKAPNYVPAKDAILDEGFEGDFLTTGWTKIVQDGNDIIQSDSEAHTGSYSARFSSFSSSSDYNQYLFSPQITILADMQLSFWHNKPSGSDILEWGISTTTNPDDFTWTDVPLENSWNEYVADLSAYVGQDVYIGFHYHGEWQYYVYLDDVVVDLSPTEPEISINYTGFNVADILQGSEASTTTAFTVSNIGAGTLEFTANSFAGTGIGWTTTFDGAVTLLAGETHDFGFTFDPTTGGIQNDVFTIVSNGGDDIEINLTATVYNEDNNVESFEVTVPPTGWTNNILSGIYAWEKYETSSQDGSYVAKYNSYYAADGDAAELITTELDMNTGVPILAFWYVHLNSAGTATNYTDVFITNDAGTTWTLLEQISGYLNYWKFYSYDLSAYTGTVQIKFVANKSGNTSASQYVDLAITPGIYVPATPPSPVTYLAPDNEAVDVELMPTLSWEETMFVDGYYVNFGTDANNLTQLADINSETYYSIESNLLYSTEYFWQIVPYNTYGSAVDCPVWSFVTIEDPTVQIPYSEDFTVYPPEKWTEATGLLANPTVLTGTSSAWSADGFANIGTTGSARMNIWSTGKKEWLFTPPINIGATGHDAILEFDLALTPYSSQTVGTPGEDDIFAVVISTDGGDTWSSANALVNYDNTHVFSLNEHVTVDLADYSGIIQLGFYAESTVNNEDNDLFIDNFKVLLQGTNLAVDTITPTEAILGNDLFPVVTISNLGTETETDFTVNIATEGYTSEKVLTGQTFAPGETMEVTMDEAWTPIADGTYTLTATVNVADDIDTDNNTLESGCVISLPDTDLAVTTITQEETLLGDELFPVITISNLGTATETDFTVNLTADDGYNSEKVLTGQTFAPGETMEVTMDNAWIPTAEGTYTLTATVNVDDDINIDNNTLESQCVILLPETDLAVTAITPEEANLGFDIYPVVTLNNEGNKTETDFTVNIATDGYTSEKVLTGQTFAPGETMEVTMDNAWIPVTEGTYSLTATVTVADDVNTDNNTLESECDIIVPFTVQIPYEIDFDENTSLPEGWEANMYVNSTHGNNGTNGLYKNLYSYSVYSYATTPLIEGIVTDAELSFEYRIVNYSSYPNTATTLGVDDNVLVSISVDGGNNYTVIYTIDQTNHITSTDFAEVTLPLTDYDGEMISVKLEGNHGEGDYYLDIDNFSVLVPTIGTDLAVTAIAPTEAFLLGDELFPVVTIDNMGTETETDFTVNLTADDGYSSEKVLTGQTFAPGETMEVTMDEAWTPATEGTYTLTATVTVDNDINTDNNTLESECEITAPFIVQIPYIVNFDENISLPEGWDANMYVSSTHGNNGTNGLCKNLYGSIQYSYATTPFIEGIVTDAELSFEYRIVNYSGYPGTATTLGTDDNVLVSISVDGGNNYTVIYTIDQTNHITSTDFAEVTLPLTDYDGEMISVKLEGNHGEGDYYLDIDNFSVLVPTIGTDLAVTAIAPTEAFLLGDELFPVVTIDNMGTETETDFTVNLTADDGYSSEKVLTGQTFEPGETMEVTMDDAWIPVTEGTYSLTATVTVADDANTDNNTLESECEITIIEPGETCDNAIDYGLINGGAINGATVEAGDIVWYSFTLDADYEDVAVSLCGSDFDTKLEVWDACDAANYIAYNDDSQVCNTKALQSHIDFEFLAAGTYYAKVYGYGSNFGDYVLNIYNPVSGTDLAVDAITPTEAFLGDELFPVVTIDNMGTETETDFTVNLTADDGYSSEKVLTGQTFEPGETMEVTMDDAWTPATEGTYTLTAIVTVVDDANTDNNTLESECEITIIEPGETCDNAIDYGLINGGAINGATVEAGDIVWYSFTLDADYEDVAVSLCGSDFDTKLEVWDACDAANYIAYNDDSQVCNTKALQSHIDFEFLAAGTYYAKVYGYGSNFGDYVLNIYNVVEIPVATVTATPGCETGSVTVSSDLSDEQTFYLCEEDGTVLEQETTTAGFYEFTDLVDGVYTGKVEKDGQMSELSAPATLTNNITTAITSQPESATVSAGSDVSFTVIADGTNLSYQWRFNETNIGDDNATYDISSVTSDDAGNYDVVVSGECGEQTSEVATLVVTNSVDELAKYGIDIYPNPSTGLFTIATDKEYEITISDITGKIILNKMIKDSKNEIDISNNATGIYFVKMKTGNNVLTFKIVKE